MTDNPNKKRDKEHKDRPYEAPADQAEGERGRNTTTKVGRTPDQAEGERDENETNLDHKPYGKGKS